MTDRNLYPHAESRVAMAMWGDEYAKQSGGCMDFWDKLSPSRKQTCVDVVNGIVRALAENGRAPEAGSVQS